MGSGDRPRGAGGAGPRRPGDSRRRGRPRVGQLAVAVARSWSNNVTASAGIVSIIGGPLATGRRRSIEEVIRTTAPMHDGFAGGAFLGPDGGLLGIATAAAIRGLGVVIPAKIAWASAAAVLSTASQARVSRRRRTAGRARRSRSAEWSTTARERCSSWR